MKLVQRNSEGPKSSEKQRTMLVDLTNLCWIQRFSDFKKNSSYDPDAWMLFFQNILGKLNKIRSDYDINNIILCDEGGNNWRKRVYSEYKANRSIETDLYFDDVNYTKEKLHEFIQDYTNQKFISVNQLEADDLIAVYSQTYKDRDELILIVSTDRDFHQLLVQENVRQFDPMKFEEKEHDFSDIGFQLFLKCIRGDTGDNIGSAYPRVREKKLREAWNEESQYEMMNIMNVNRKEDGLPVKDIYERNRQLIDLTQQPESLREEAKEGFESLQTSQHNYDIVQTRQWLKDHEFYSILEKYDQFEFLFKAL